MNRFIHRLARERRGVTIVEFAIVAPVMLLLLFGLSDLLYRGYVQAILSGAVQKAGRDSTIEGGGQNAAALDAAVAAIVRNVAPRATFSSTRRSYAKFSNAAPEPFVDSNGNGIRDPGECFTDINGNGVWDADPGITGQGGASDTTIYTMTITYPRLFPLSATLGWSAKQTLSATTFLKNQPYATQLVNTPATICK